MKRFFVAMFVLSAAANASLMLALVFVAGQLQHASVGSTDVLNWRLQDEINDKQVTVDRAQDRLAEINCQRIDELESLVRK